MAEHVTLEQIIKAIILFEDDKTGKITFYNIKKIIKEIWANIMDNEI